MPTIIGGPPTSFLVPGAGVFAYQLDTINVVCPGGAKTVTTDISARPIASRIRPGSLVTGTCESLVSGDTFRRTTLLNAQMNANLNAVFASIFYDDDSDSVFLMLRSDYANIPANTVVVSIVVAYLE
jgi:hypothetical protein